MRNDIIVDVCINIFVTMCLGCVAIRSTCVRNVYRRVTLFLHQLFMYASASAKMSCTLTCRVCRITGGAIMKNGSGYDAFKTLGGLSIERSAYILVIGGLSIKRSAYILVIGGLSIERSAYILVIALGPYATCCPRPTWCSAHMLVITLRPHVSYYAPPTC